MLRKLLPENYETSPLETESGILQSLKNIENQLQKELGVKQNIIEKSWAEVRHLRGQLDRKDANIQELQARLSESQKHIEGNRQLINKLLSDLAKTSQDLEWYRRTYEQRSFLGTVRQKLFKK
jgi:peptidoglycan hydrolase CwlO-like protein